MKQGIELIILLTSTVFLCVSGLIELSSYQTPSFSHPSDGNTQLNDVPSHRRLQSSSGSRSYNYIPDMCIDMLQDFGTEVSWRYEVETKTAFIILSVHNPNKALLLASVGDIIKLFITVSLYLLTGTGEVDHRGLCG
ncbi:hypothetical protein EON65_58315 [archaeon]|nr:MAG: hypothetical protein EON65_58315 [archaeon]